MRQKPLLKLLTETGPLIAVAVAIALLVGVAGPAAAQFFNFGGPQRSYQRGGGGDWFGGWFGGGNYNRRGGDNSYWPRRGGDDFYRRGRGDDDAPRRGYQDSSRAPAPEKRDAAEPQHKILVLGDGMADWLAYGLEDAYTDQPDMGVIRKIKTSSGLIQYQPKGAPETWAAAARDILASEKPDVIVVMLGLSDRAPLHEPVPEKTDKPADKKTDKNARKPDAKSPDAKGDATAKDDKDSELPQDEAANADAQPPIAPAKSARSPNGIYQFREDRWVELYNRKIEEMISVLKSKGVPVVWVGLPAVRGPKGTSDTLFLDSLYREAAAKAGITYVDDWDGFVDEAGRFLQKGPDFEGQIRQLRTYDGTYFTQAGARKLAHYVEREITRVLAARSGPVALPTEPGTPDSKGTPGQPSRPLAGPIVPLVAASVNSDQLLGGPGTPPATVDTLTARTLIKGEALTPPAGRADDFVWPRREAGRQLVKSDASAADAPATTAAIGPPAPSSPNVAAAPPAAQQKPRRLIQQQRPPAQPWGAQPFGPGGQNFMDFFGFGGAPRQQAPFRPPAWQRQPGNAGHAASVQ